MPIRPEMLVRGLDGRPEPPPELLAKLRRYDPRVGLFYTKAAWAITEQWRPDDPRREWIQRGEMPADMAFDICGYLPVTCSLDEAPGYIERELKSWKPEEFRALREAYLKWNFADGGGQDEAGFAKVMAGVEESLTKDGPTLGKFNVPVQLVDNTAPAPPADPAIDAALGRKRKKVP